ncbi:hypothetical protein PLICRDRAFT_702515 [Plicaturopsis crispa FD-325 SS-3]|uniref:DUF6697 domain-containing protein n=1 Tax=Plicaturopsis crispa FD-325 SS-3 TaxID=944288 RepID=A0A0C9SVZ4_PLICR|nr:hypothetical protein PLICRDRAFT_702515 [Plicaturopsis crispa FD-325 SS-3]
MAATGDEWRTLLANLPVHASAETLATRASALADAVRANHHLLSHVLRELMYQADVRPHLIDPLLAIYARLAAAFRGDTSLVQQGFSGSTAVHKLFDSDIIERSQAFTPYDVSCLVSSDESVASAARRVIAVADARRSWLITYVLHARSRVLGVGMESEMGIIEQDAALDDARFGLGLGGRGTQKPDEVHLLAALVLVLCAGRTLREAAREADREAEVLELHHALELRLRTEVQFKMKYLIACALQTLEDDGAECSGQRYRTPKFALAAGDQLIMSNPSEIADDAQIKSEEQETGIQDISKLELTIVRSRSVSVLSVLTELSDDIQNVEGFPTIKPEASDHDAVPSPSESRPPPPLPLVFDCIEVPSLECIKLKYREEKMMKASLARLRNPEVKVTKKNSEGLGIRSVYNRLNAIGAEQYPVPLDEVTKAQVFSRYYISGLFGGNPQDTTPPISAKHLAEHGHKDWMYLSLDYNPHAPQVPGAPGLFFTAHGNSPIEDDPAIWILFTRLETSAWIHCGKYRQWRAPSLSTEEFGELSDRVKMTWAVNICKHDWGNPVQVRVALRKILRREPTQREEQAELNKEKNVLQATLDLATKEDVLRAYLRGQESIEVWYMKCVDYDVDMQHKMVDGLKSWHPKAKNTSKKSNSAPKKSATASKKTHSKGPGRKRKRSPSFSSDKEPPSDLDDMQGDFDSEHDGVRFTQIDFSIGWIEYLGVFARRVQGLP